MPKRRGNARKDDHARLQPQGSLAPSLLALSAIVSVALAAMSTDVAAIVSSTAAAVALSIAALTYAVCQRLDRLQTTADQIRDALSDRAQRSDTE